MYAFRLIHPTLVTFTDSTRNFSTARIATRQAQHRRAVTTIALPHRWVPAFSASSASGAVTAMWTNMAVQLTVVEGPSTSRMTRVGAGSVPIRNFSRNRDRAARVYANLISKPRYPPVACPSHLTMLSDRSVFNIISGLFSRRRLGLKLPKYGLGAPPRRSRRRRSRHHLFPPSRTAWSPRLVNCDEHRPTLPAEE
jgi:hypothetical protein